MTEAQGSVPGGSEPGEAGAGEAGAVAPGEAAGSSAPGEEPGEELLPTLQEEFAELSPELRRSMLGKPAQMITGLLIGALVLVALLIGVTSLAKNGAVPLISPAPVVSPSAVVIGGWRA